MPSILLIARNGRNVRATTKIKVSLKQASSLLSKKYRTISVSLAITKISFVFEASSQLYIVLTNFYISTICLVVASSHMLSLALQVWN